MKIKRIIITAAASGLVAVGAQAQTNDQLQKALAQAQAAAEQAQAAANQAQAALAQALAAADSAKQSSMAAKPASNALTTNGLTVTSGANTATLYGLIDITLFNKNNATAATPTASAKSLTSPGVSWMSGNRWGLTGSHALGSADGDLKAIFRLESEFESQTGAMDTPGVLFNRDAWLGVESKTLGKLTFGRQNALGRDPAASAVYGDPYGPAKASVEEGGYTNNNNFKQLIFYAGSATGTRLNNGVVWKKAFSNGLVAGAAYAFGAVPGSFNTGSSKTGSLAYNGDGYTVAGFATSANISNLTHRTVSFGGNVQVSPLIRLNAGYYKYNAQQAAGLGDRNDTAYTLSTKVTPGGAWDYELGYQTMRANNAGVNAAGFVQNAYSDTSAILAKATGNRNTLYGSVFYHFDSSTELYLAFDRLNTTGGYLAAQANGAKSQNEFGLGMRYRF